MRPDPLIAHKNAFHKTEKMKLPPAFLVSKAFWNRRREGNKTSDTEFYAVCGALGSDNFFRIPRLGKFSAALCEGKSLFTIHHPLTTVHCYFCSAVSRTSSALATKTNFIPRLASFCLQYNKS
jgi:hypothetical protein